MAERTERATLTRRRRARWSVLASAVAGLLVVPLVAGPAGADDPPFIPWSAMVPGLSRGYQPSAANECVSGRIACVDSVIGEMHGRFQPLAAACDHDAVFALTYLRTTEEYRRTAADSTFFSDTPFVNHQDAVFAQDYFDAYDAWHRGDKTATPPAWRVAFETAGKRQVTALGNLMLGMAAHVNRDLPFVLAEIGLVKPDGSSRKGDHDKVNRFLNRVMEPLLAEVARRFDPTADDGQTSWTQLDETSLLQLVVGWRELAWRNAELLAAAPTPAVRDLVAAEIEASAALTSRLIATATSYGPLDWLLGRRAARDSYCAANWNRR